MIEAVARPDGTTVLSVSLEPGTVAYVDADWLPPGRSGSVPAIVVDAGIDADSQGALPVVRFARRVVAALDRAATDRVLVQGVGLVADLIRRSLAAPDAPSGAQGSSPPDAVVDVTGDPQRIIEATRLVNDLGTIVLAGEPLGRRLDADLYADVHSRGLTLRGVARQSDLIAAEAGEDDLRRVAAPTVLQALEPVPSEGLWYRIEPRGA